MSQTEENLAYLGGSLPHVQKPTPPTEKMAAHVSISRPVVQIPGIDRPLIAAKRAPSFEPTARSWSAACWRTYNELVKPFDFQGSIEGLAWRANEQGRHHLANALKQAAWSLGKPPAWRPLSYHAIYRLEPIFGLVCIAEAIQKHAKDERKPELIHALQIAIDASAFDPRPPAPRAFR